MLCVTEKYPYWIRLKEDGEEEGVEAAEAEAEDARHGAQAAPAG